MLGFLKNNIRNKVAPVDEPIPFAVNDANWDALTAALFDPATGKPREHIDGAKLKALQSRYPGDVFENMNELKRPVILPDGSRLIGLFSPILDSDPSAKFAVKQLANGSFGGETASKVMVALLLAGNAPGTSAALLFDPDSGEIWRFGQKARLAAFDYIRDPVDAARQFNGLAELIKKYGTHFVASEKPAACDCEGHRGFMQYRVTSGQPSIK